MQRLYLDRNQLHGPLPDETSKLLDPTRPSTAQIVIHLAQNYLSCCGGGWSGQVRHLLVCWWAGLHDTRIPTPEACSQPASQPACCDGGAASILTDDADEPGVQGRP